MSQVDNDLSRAMVLIDALNSYARLWHSEFEYARDCLADEFAEEADELARDQANELIAKRVKERSDLPVGFMGVFLWVIGTY